MFHLWRYNFHCFVIGAASLERRLEYATRRKVTLTHLSPVWDKLRGEKCPSPSKSKLRNLITVIASSYVYCGNYSLWLQQIAMLSMLLAQVRLFRIYHKQQ